MGPASGFDHPALPGAWLSAHGNEPWLLSRGGVFWVLVVVKVWDDPGFEEFLQLPRWEIVHAATAGASVGKERNNSLNSARFAVIASSS